MIEIELFFKTVESEIRRKHIKYLKKQKCVTAAGCSLAGKEGETSDDFPAGEKARYVKRFNKGIDTALKVLQDEYDAFKARLEKSIELDNRGCNL